MCNLLGWVTSVAMGIAVLVGPWFFGAWEMWWFWLFFCFIGLAALFGGIRLTAATFKREDASRISDSAWVVLLVLPFLLYALIRILTSPVVFMDAERMLLLHTSGIVVAGLSVFVLGPVQRRVLFWGLFGSLLLMGVYGVVNHIAFGSHHVLWMPRYEQYAGRATGPYYCPDHFAGAMELLFCMGAGVLLDRTARGLTLRIVALLAALIAVAGIILSQSRGAGLTLAVIVGCILLWGFMQWPQAIRWYWRLITVSLLLLIVIGALMAYPDYVKRFATYGNLHKAGEGDERSVVEDVVFKLKRTSRGRMYGGAWRAWQSAPLLGVGPGMHQHLWPQFAATDDGDRDAGEWPTLTNHDFHSYEVHSDWLQLLEEFGIIGILLFAIPMLVLMRIYWRRLSSERAYWKQSAGDGDTDGVFAYVLCGWLALLAMAFHSLGDFNLQMPGTVWMLALLIGVAVGEIKEKQKAEID